MSWGGGGLYFYKYKNNLDQFENVHYNSELKASTLQHVCQVTKLAQ